MDSTSANLLRRLRTSDAESAWERFIELYTPLIFFWARKRGLNANDASDLVQDVLLTLVQRIGDFDPDGQGRFRGWLRTITVNRAIDFHRRRNKRLENGAASTLSALAIESEIELWDDVDYRQQLVSRELELLRTEFQASTWDAAQGQLIDGKSAMEIAQSLGITLNAAYVAKSRVLARLREELDGLLD